MTESDLAERLQHLETLLAERSAPVIGHLRPRATADEITATLTDAGVFSHPDLTTWFGWHDGTDTPSAHTPPGLLPPGPENRLIGPWHLLSLDQALAEHERFQQVEQETPIGLYPPAGSPSSAGSTTRWRVWTRPAPAVRPGRCTSATRTPA